MLNQMAANIRLSYARRPHARLFLIISLVLWASVSMRWVLEFIEGNHPLTAVLTGMLFLFGVLSGLEPLLTGGSTARAHLYLVFQTALVFGASLLYFELDFFAILYLPLCGQAIYLFPRPVAYRWVAALTAVTFVGQFFQFGWPESLPFFLLYGGALFFVAAFSVLTIQADEARKKSEALLDELQDAHRRLQDFAGQAESLAIAEERNRLARELHDTVAQTLYGITLQSEAARRHLVGGKQDLVDNYLMGIQETTQQTLQETRLLIFELRPPVVESEGLAAAIRVRLAAVEERSGLTVHHKIEDIGRLAPEIETGLYRIGQEALNNIIRHAQASGVEVGLSQSGGRVQLVIVDDGLGFDPDALGPGGLGIQGMRERAAQLGAVLNIHSQPGEGTRLSVEVPV